MVRTAVGYAGGTTRNPTYYHLSDHTETIQIEYDPSVVSYEELLDIFWSSHNPHSQPGSRQYMAIVYYHNEEQRRLGVETRDQVATETGRQVFTEIVPYSAFYLAEEYHQKFRLRQDRILEGEFIAMYPGVQDLVASTAAARVNGYVAGYGTIERLREELKDLGLSREASKRLWDTVSALQPGEVKEQCPID